MTTDGSPNLLSALTASCNYRVVETGTALFEEGQACRGIYLLLSAKVRLVKKASGGDLEIQPNVTKGSVLGLSDLLARRAHPVTAIVVESGEVGFIGMEALAPLLSRRIDALATAIRTNIEARVQLTLLIAEVVGAILDGNAASAEATLAS